MSSITAPPRLYGLSNYLTENAAISCWSMPGAAFACILSSPAVKAAGHRCYRKPNRRLNASRRRLYARHSTLYFRQIEHAGKQFNRHSRLQAEQGRIRAVIKFEINHDTFGADMRDYAGAKRPSTRRRSPAKLRPRQRSERGALQSCLRTPSTAPRGLTSNRTSSRLTGSGIVVSATIHPRLLSPSTILCSTARPASGSAAQRPFPAISASRRPALGQASGPGKAALGDATPSEDEPERSRRQPDQSSRCRLSAATAPCPTVANDRNPERDRGTVGWTAFTGGTPLTALPTAAHSHRALRAVLLASLRTFWGLRPSQVKAVDVIG